ncbi:MAG: segregation/condensation protein A [Deltaproteobacteria bacterium]|nr:segregation/condensation protein A [Deltaproteobacteria bacterium]
MSYRVKLEVFEGPLDLLLHLIKKEEVDIYDIPVARITDEYLQYLGLLDSMNLDVAGEYLVMAATLTHIKSRMLLPPSDDETEEPDEDPRADLVHQLVEYQRFREAAAALGERPVLTRDVFRREPAVPDRDPGEGVRLRDVTVADLLEAFREVMERALRESFHEIVHEEISVDECERLIVRRMELDGPLRFRDLFVGLPSRRRLVATFLALLELVKRQEIHARQEEDGAEILLFPRAADAPHLDGAP